MKELLEEHGERVKAAIEAALGGDIETKFIITAGDEKVCPQCQLAELDGAIPIDQPYSNGKMGPTPFHWHCRCKQVTSKELAADLEVRATEDYVDVGIFNPAGAHAAGIREFGSGHGPPNPAIQVAMMQLKDDVFRPLESGIGDNLAKYFLTRR